MRPRLSPSDLINALAPGAGAGTVVAPGTGRACSVSAGAPGAAEAGCQPPALPPSQGADGKPAGGAQEPDVQCMQH